MKRFILPLLLLALSSADALAYRVSAWVPAWAGDAYESLQLHGGSLDETNPTWYELNADGSIARKWNAENAAWRAAMAPTSMIPTIQNTVGGRFDGAVVSAVLGSAQGREAHAEAIVRLTIEQALDGIDLDYESLPASERENFSLFVELLAGKLHATGRVLSVSIHAKTSDAQDWKGPGAQDWVRIGAAADSVKIMAYDYHWATSSPGPIAPLSWIEAVAAYAVSTIPAEKIVLALPWYGYDWGSAGGTGVTWSQGVALAASTGSTIGRDANGEATFTYPGHTVFFQDGESFRRKVDAILARFPSIGGFALWRLGSEDPAKWDVIATIRGTGGTGATPPPGTFTVEGPASVTMERGESASVDVRVIPIDGFSGNVAARIVLPDGFPGAAALTTAVAGPNGTISVALTADKKAAAGTYHIDLVLEAHTMTLTHRVTVEILPPGRGRLVRR